MLILKKIKGIILDAVFPHKCVCGEWGTLLCDSCKAQLKIKNTCPCPVCKKISDYGRTCTACRHKSELTGVMVLGSHKGILKDLIWKYKYHFITDLSQVLASLIFEKYGNFIRDKRFLVTYVPISRARLNWRGFNQAQLLAREVALKTNLHCENLLYKANKVESQVGHSRLERLQNLRGKIRYVGPKEVSTKKVLIIDDVYTTGATLEECAKVLREAGYREIWGLVLSRD